MFEFLLTLTILSTILIIITIACLFEHSGIKETSHKIISLICSFVFSMCFFYWTLIFITPYEYEVKKTKIHNISSDSGITQIAVIDGNVYNLSFLMGRHFEDEYIKYKLLDPHVRGVKLLRYTSRIVFVGQPNFISDTDINNNNLEKINILKGIHMTDYMYIDKLEKEVERLSNELESEQERSIELQNINNKYKEYNMELESKLFKKINNSSLNERIRKFTDNRMNFAFLLTVPFLLAFILFLGIIYI